MSHSISNQLAPATNLTADGYALLPSLLDASCVRQLLAALAPLGEAHAHRNLLSVPAISALATSAPVLPLMQSHLGPAALAVRAILFDKLPTANWKVTWHQDLSIAVRERRDLAGFGPWSVKDRVPHVQPPREILESMLTLRLHLDACTTGNGPLRVIAGSHRHGVFSASEIARHRQSAAETECLLPEGGALLMRPLLLHASSPALRPAHRRVIHIEYAAGPLPQPLRWHADAL